MSHSARFNRSQTLLGRVHLVKPPFPSSLGQVPEEEGEEVLRVPPGAPAHPPPPHADRLQERPHQDHEPQGRLTRADHQPGQRQGRGKVSLHIHKYTS